MKETVYRITKLKFPIPKNTSIEIPADIRHYESNFLQVLVKNFWGKPTWRFIPCDAGNLAKKIDSLSQLPKQIDDKPFFQFINHQDESKLQSQFIEFYPDISVYLQIKRKSITRQLEKPGRQVISRHLKETKHEPRMMNRLKWAAIWFLFVLLSVVTSCVF
jgi:hypothetical protein